MKPRKNFDDFLSLFHTIPVLDAHEQMERWTGGKNHYTVSHKKHVTTFLPRDAL